MIYKNFIQKEFFNLNNNKKINKKFYNILNNITFDLNSSKSVFNSLSNKFKFNFKIKDLNKFKKFNTVVIIGMGGSILGSEAIYSFLKKKIKKDFIFLNNIDEDELQKIKSKQKLSKILFIIISKSGNTIETLSNIRALKIIKKKSKNIIIISEKKQNPLYLLSKKMQIFHIEHKSYIGGRYSVLSEAGMVPAYLMGLNISKLRKNLLNHFRARNKIYLKDSSIKLASILQKKKLSNLIFFNYVPQLNKFLYWNQQLIAESLGKNGKGFLPIISSAPRDHHSLLQLYLDGPKDKLFYVFSSDTDNKKKINSNILGKKLNFLNNKSINQIKIAQKNAFLKVLKKKRIPFREFKIGDISEKALGELFSYFILETVIVGKIANINPFNQPAVEEVKVYTKKILY
ncbi:glucose-6-phosphate isomerase [Pelagibacterales bacterium SAG-MED05]|nr:glucose-6-phosphate isomerase [Pelagibacterales bacterium SAG-MED05]